MKNNTKSIDYINQERSRYNRQSGKKTLFLVGVLIFFVVILALVTLVMI